MDIASTDTSNGAQIAALQKRVDDLSARVGPDLLDGPSVNPDHAALMEKRQARAEKAERMLPERRELLLRVDEAIDQLAECVMAERALRADIRAIGLPKEFREPMSDEIVLNAILAKLAEKGVGRDRGVLDRSIAKPPLAALADLHPIILRAIRG